MNNKNHVKIIRLDNEGFKCKPYTSPAYHHVFEFIDTEIKDLNVFEQSIEESKLHRPELNDWDWSGCFCFLDEYNKANLSENGALAMRRNDKRNVAYLPFNELIWVRNISHFGKEHPYYSEFMYSILHEGEEHWFYNARRFDAYRWVRMRIDLALERTRLWKEFNPNSPIPEWLTEFYLMEEQRNKLVSPSFKDKVFNLGINLGLFK